MKGKKFYFILAGILLVGLSTIYFFRQQREKQFLKFEAYEIASVEAQVDGLYNEDKTDILEDVSTEELESIDELLHDLKVKEYSNKNEQRLNIVESEFITAKKMNTLQVDINALFIETGIIEKNISLNEVENLEEQIIPFKEKTVYYDRNAMTLDDAKEQVKNIETARTYIENLFEEDFVRSDVTREDEEEALKLIKKIKNEDVKEELLVRAETLNLALTEAEEALALEEALAAEAAQQELEALEALEEEQYESSTESNWDANNSGSWNSSGSSWQPPSNSGSGGSTWTPSPTNPPNESTEATEPENNPSEQEDELEAPPADPVDPPENPPEDPPEETLEESQNSTNEE